jgi:hypothetical protein
MAATVAGVLAFLAVKEPWAHLTITQPATDTIDAVVVEVTVRGHAAFVGTVGTVLAVMLAASGLMWFFYGFQRGRSMPGILNPGALDPRHRRGSGRGAAVLDGVVRLV